MTLTPTTGGTADDIVDGELVPVDAAPVHTLVGASEWDGVDTGDMAPEPASVFLTLIPMNGKLDGGFTDPDTGETGRLEYDFVWLAKGKTRAAFIEEADGKIRKKDYNAKEAEGPGCRSFNGTTADPNSPLLQNGGDCTTCPLAQWSNGEPPVCKDAVTAMAFIPDETGGRLASFRFKGLSAGPARNYWRSFDERLPVIPPIAFVTHVALEPVDTDNGKFLQARFERGTQLTRAEAQPLIDERARRLADWEKVIATDVVSDTGGEGGAGGPFDGPDKSNEPFTDDDASAVGRPIHKDDVAGRFGASEEEFDGSEF